MTSEQWLQLKEIFHEAALLLPKARSAFLHERCDGDAEMLRELQMLLESHDEAEHFIEQPALASASEIFSIDGKDFWIGRTIGPYRILREVGRGGMGVVYLAERQDEQFRQRVAIKLVKRGLDTEDILRRFRNERQILATLNHPNIARLFDGGMTEDGLPYFVMEYIEGLPLLEYCKEHAISIEECLKLFRTICAAVQHAHQNLVIHRDLKPSNILVTHEGEVRLLDFGVAKFLNPELTCARDMAQTQTRFRLLTPEYASPEQVRGEHITTASDIYSLGVILYELLTGARPFKPKNNSPEELSRAICDLEPTKPSEAIRCNGASRRSSPYGHNDSAQQNTQAEPGRGETQILLRNPKALKGDLDNIVLMALKKEPARRYKSVEQFSEDISRHLAGLPVTARKDTFSYRTAKFINRNRVGVAAASLLFLTLLGGIVATIWQASRAREQARIANAKSLEAQAALAKTEKINRFMQTIFSYANPDWFGRAGGRRDMSVLEAMRDIEKHIDTDFRDEPELRADVYQQIGDAYRTQALFDDAERNLREALRLRLELYGEDSAKVAESMYILSGVRYHQGDVAEQESLLTKALSIQRRHPNEGNNLPYMMVDYASFLWEFKTDYAGAAALDREALEDFRRRYGEQHYMIGETQVELAMLYLSLGDYAQAQAFAQKEQHDEQRPSSHFSILRCLALIQINKGDYRAAEETMKQMLAQAQSESAQPSDIAYVQDMQSEMAYRQGDYAQAKAYADKALTVQSDIGMHYYRIGLLARCLNKLGQAKRAEILLREPVERLNKPEQMFSLAFLKSVLGESLTAQRRFTEAETVLLEAYKMQKAHVLPQQYDLVETRRRLADLYRAWGKPDEAA